MPPTPQQARFEKLASKSGIEAVAQMRLPDGTTILTATTGGELVAVEALDADGRRLDELDPLGLLRRLGVVREQALTTASQALDAIVNLTAIRQADGADVNLAEVAREGGVGARQTLYDRLQAVEVAGKSKRTRARR